MTEQQKQKAREILYSQPRIKDLVAFTGKKSAHISQNKKDAASVNGSKVARTYLIDVLRWKIDQICKFLKDSSEIMQIIDADPKGTDLAKNAGVSPAAISVAKKNHKNKSDSYAYSFYLLSWQIEKIAEAIDA